MEKKVFYDAIRTSIFGGRLISEQVNGIESILDYWENLKLLPYTGTDEKELKWRASWESDWAVRCREQLSYILATSYHETAHTFSPITEFGGISYFDKYDTGKLAAVLGNSPQKDGDGFLFRGRGDIQVTGVNSYRGATTICRRFLEDVPDFEKNPDALLDNKYSKISLIAGMMSGIYTGKKLPSYVYRRDGKTEVDFQNARRVVNGIDRAEKIALYATKFNKALTDAEGLMPCSWIGVDLDGTLAYYDGWKGVAHIGHPIPKMVDRVVKWILDGKNVKIFTARVHPLNSDSAAASPIISEWLKEHVLYRLPQEFSELKIPIVCEKDMHMTELWDDRCVQVILNTGNRADEKIP